jgi:hypothetical protein
MQPNPAEYIPQGEPAIQKLLQPFSALFSVVSLGLAVFHSVSPGVAYLSIAMGT